MHRILTKEDNLVTCYIDKTLQHRKVSVVDCQFWTLGRTANPENLDKEGFPYISSGDKPMTSISRTPRPLTIPGARLS